MYLYCNFVQQKKLTQYFFHKIVRYHICRADAAVMAHMWEWFIMEESSTNG